MSNRVQDVIVQADMVLWHLQADGCVNRGEIAEVIRALQAKVAEAVDAAGLNPADASRAGSSPVLGTSPARDVIEAWDAYIAHAPQRTYRVVRALKEVGQAIERLRVGPEVEGETVRDAAAWRELLIPFVTASHCDPNAKKGWPSMEGKWTTVNVRTVDYEAARAALADQGTKP